MQDWTVSLTNAVTDRFHKEHILVRIRNPAISQLTAIPIMQEPGGVVLKPSAHAVELSFPLPNAPETKIYLRLTINTTSLLLFLTTAYGGDTPTAALLGSFVYALPDRNNPGQTISTPLYTYESSVEFTTRMARLLARKTGKPVYVGSSMSFANTGLGGTVEEEIEGFKNVVEVVMSIFERRNGLNVNGISVQ